MLDSTKWWKWQTYEILDRVEITLDTLANDQIFIWRPIEMTKIWLDTLTTPCKSTFDHWWQVEMTDTNRNYIWDEDNAYTHQISTVRLRRSQVVGKRLGPCQYEHGNTTHYGPTWISSRYKKSAQRAWLTHLTFKHLDRTRTHKNK